MKTCVQDSNEMLEVIISKLNPLSLSKLLAIDKLLMEN